MRIGQGYDIHRLKEGRRLVLGGVEIPAEKGCLGHSDGDVLIHAIIDAILGSLCLGDIGNWFPDTSAEFKDIDSRILLQRVMSSPDLKEWGIVNIDSTIITEKPKLAPHMWAMSESIAELLRTSVENVSVKAKTNEQLGEIGQGNAIAAQAVVLIKPRKNS